MATAINWYGWDEARYHAALLNEAARDVVFLMEIENQLRQGFKCAEEEIPSYMQRAIQHLLENEASVGFAEPGTGSWRPQNQLASPPKNMAERIVALWRNEPEFYDCLVFVRRKH